LRLLRDTGVRVAIDDFGTGYSSMSYLKRFPVQTLKIAQAFMRDVHVDIQSAAIASMLIQLCRELDLDVVAEGVEHPSQLEFLRERGCYVIQGRIFSGPLRAEDLEVMLERGIELAV
jgi:EAL domain-containing protein (putative c-di-GMP-specific phosphodiesterase class I)